MKKICFIFCCFFMFALNVFADDLYSISYDGSGALEVRKNNVTTNDYASALTADSAGNIVLKEGVSIDTITTVNKSISITSNNKEISINSITVGTTTSSNLTINNAKLNFGGGVTSSGNITISSSTLNITGGDFEATGNMSITNSTIKGNAHNYHSNGTLNVSGTNTYGAHIESGSLTIESGTINSNGTTSYGVRMTNGTYTQGIYDGRGTESADVSLTDPSITATGTTTGIGVSMGSGTMKYYDGYIHGSTSAFATGDIVSETEKNYQLLLSDENRTSVLEYTR